MTCLRVSAIRLNEKRKNFGSDTVRSFDAGKMGSVDFHIARAGNLLCEESTVGRRGCGIVSAREDQSRKVDSGNRVAGIKIANGATTANIAVGILRGHGAKSRGDELRRAGLKRRREPTSGSGVGDFLHAFG